MSLQASRQLEETAVALQDTVAKLEQLAVANSRLSAGTGDDVGLELPLCPPFSTLTALPLADHSSLMTSLANLEQERDARQQERDALQQENEKQQEEMAWWVQALGQGIGVCVPP